MRKCVFLALLFTFLSSVVWATDLKEIMDKLAEKQAKTKNSLTSVKIISETVTSLGESKIVMRGVVYQKGNKIRSESEPIETSSDIPKEYLQKTVTVFDGKDLWIISPVGTQRIPMALGDVEKLKPLDDLTWLTDYANYMTLKGEEVVNGHPCYVISISKPSEMVLYLDKNSLEWVKSEQDINGDKMVVERKDFRSLPGIPEVSIPYKIFIFMNGEKLAETTVKDVQVNPSIPDTLFVVKTSVPSPSKVKGKGEGEGDSGKGAWDKLKELAK